MLLTLNGTFLALALLALLGLLGLLSLAGRVLRVGRLVGYGITPTRNPVDAPVADSAGSRHGTSYLAPVRPADHHAAP
ncbi:hypothetical protein [Streptomyces sp. NPDC006645]|uniref:hypothetical protein n=1 Tax=unclassified Streptomyces TaxID=2593676 RepID=UPI0033AFE3F3